MKDKIALLETTLTTELSFLPSASDQDRLLLLHLCSGSLHCDVRMTSPLSPSAAPISTTSPTALFTPPFFSCQRALPSAPNKRVMYVHVFSNYSPRILGCGNLGSLGLSLGSSRSVCHSARERRRDTGHTVVPWQRARQLPAACVQGTRRCGSTRAGQWP